MMQDCAQQIKQRKCTSSKIHQEIAQKGCRSWSANKAEEMYKLKDLPMREKYLRKDADLVSK